MRPRLFPLVVIGLASPLAAQAPDWGTAQTVEVALESFRYAPASLQFEHGQPYRLHLVNHASGGHDFAAREFFAAAKLRPQDAAKVAKGEIELGGGESADIRFVAPAKPGTYKVHCSHFMHSTMGMTGEIVVR